MSSLLTFNFSEYMYGFMENLNSLKIWETYLFS